MNPQEKTAEEYYREKLHAARAALIEGQQIIPVYRPAWGSIDDIISKLETMIITPL